MIITTELDDNLILLLRQLTFVEVAARTNGRHTICWIEWNDHTDAQVLKLLDKLINLRWYYINACQRNHGLQLALPYLELEPTP